MVTCGNCGKWLRDTSAKKPGIITDKNKSLFFKGLPVGTCICYDCESKYQHRGQRVQAEILPENSMFLYISFGLFSPCTRSPHDPCRRYRRKPLISDILKNFESRETHNDHLAHCNNEFFQYIFVLVKKISLWSINFSFLTEFREKKLLIHEFVDV